MWTLANHPRIPKEVREYFSQFGTCKDEFLDGLGEGWQRQLHIYTYPLYYINYCMAQTVAFQFWIASMKDHDDAWQRYLRFVDAGGTKTLEDLVTNEGKHYDVCVAIGPMIMMKFCCLTTQKYNIPTIVSMNPIMVDGTGMCGACRVMVGDEVKFACVDGPEFDGHLIDFDQAMQRQAMYRTEEGRAKLAFLEGETHHGGCGHCGGDK